jgi:hypothetical protein
MRPLPGSDVLPGSAAHDGTDRRIRETTLLEKPLLTGGIGCVICRPAKFLLPD